MINRFSLRVMGLALVWAGLACDLPAALPDEFKTDNLFLPAHRSTRGYVEVMQKAVWVPVQNIARRMDVGQVAPLLQKNQTYYVGIYRHDDGFTELFAVPRILPDGSGSAWTTKDNVMTFGAATPTSLGRFFLRPAEFLPVDSETPEEYVVTCERNGYTFPLRIPRGLAGTRVVKELPDEIQYLVQLRDRQSTASRARLASADAAQSAVATPSVLSPDRPDDPDYVNPYPEQVMAVTRAEPSLLETPSAPTPLQVAAPPAPTTLAASTTPPADPPRPRVVRRHVIESLTNDVTVEFQAPAAPANAAKAGSQRKPKPAPATTVSTDVEIAFAAPTTTKATASESATAAAQATSVQPPPPAVAAPAPPAPVVKTPAPPVAPTPTPAVPVEVAADPDPFSTKTTTPAPTPSVASAPAPNAPGAVSPAGTQPEPQVALAAASPAPAPKAPGAPLAVPAAAATSKPTSSPLLAMAVKILVFLALLTASFVVVVIVLALFLNRKKSKQSPASVPPSLPRSQPAAGTTVQEPNAFAEPAAAPVAAESAALQAPPSDEEFANAPAEDSGTFTGSLESFSVAELIQFLYSSRETGVLSLDPPHEDVTSKLFLERGEIIDALSAKHTAEKAVQDILAFREGLFSFTRQQEIQTQRTIKQSTMSLLLQVQPDNASEEMMAAG